MSNQGDPSGHIKHLHTTHVHVRPYGRPSTIEDHRGLSFLRQPADVTVDDATQGRVDFVGHAAVPAGSKVVALTGRSAPPGPVIPGEGALGYDEAGFLYQCAVVPDELPEGFTPSPDACGNGLLRFPKGGVTGGETGMSGQTTKTFMPDGNRWLPNITETPRRDFWVYDYDFGFDPADVVLQYGGHWPTSYEDHRGHFGPAFKRTMRSRSKRRDTATEAPLPESCDYGDQFLGDAAFLADRSPGYDAVRFTANVPDSEGRADYFYLDFEDYDAYDEFIESITRPFFIQPTDSWEHGYANIQIAPLVGERREFRCVVTDEDENEVTSSASWVVVSEVPTNLNPNSWQLMGRQWFVSHPTTTITLHAGERLAVTYQDMTSSQLYVNLNPDVTYRWRIRDNPSSSWTWLTDSIVGEPALNIIMPPLPDPDEGYSRQIQCVSNRSLDSDIIDINVLGQNNATALAITSQPLDLLLDTRSWARWTRKVAVTATGKGLSYQWQTRLGDGTNPGDEPWADIPDATSPVLDVNALLGDYEMRRTDQLGRYVAMRGYPSWETVIDKIFWDYRHSFWDHWTWRQYHAGLIPGWTKHEEVQILAPWASTGGGAGEAMSWFTEIDNPVVAPTPAEIRWWYEKYDGMSSSWAAPVKGTSYDGFVKVWHFDDTSPEWPCVEWPMDPDDAVATWEITPGATPVAVGIVKHVSYYSGDPKTESYVYDINPDDPEYADADAVWATEATNRYSDSTPDPSWYRNQYIRIPIYVDAAGYRYYTGQSAAIPVPQAEPGDLDHYISGPDFVLVEDEGTYYMDEYDPDTDVQHTPYTYSEIPEYFPLTIHPAMTIAVEWSRRKDIPLPYSVPAAAGGIILGGTPTPPPP